MEATTDTVMVTFRVTPEVLERMDALRRTDVGEMSRNRVAVAALLEGLAVLEKRRSRKGGRK